jgi:UDP-glucose 4-epimerase
MQGHGIKNLVFSSSATVYGDPVELPLREDMPTGRPTNPYGQSKMMVELVLRDIYPCHLKMRVSERLGRFNSRRVND